MQSKPLYNQYTMAESSPPEKPSSPEPLHSGIEIQGGQVRAGRDIVGGDVNIGGDSISGGTVSIQRGFSAAEVQRLVLIVGGLVLATALVFFIVGAVAAASLASVLNKPLVGGSSPEAAVSMQRKITALNDLPSGQAFRVNFAEDEISSYFRFVLGPAIGISDGKARFTDVPGQIVIGGNADNVGGLPMMAVVQTTTDPVPFRLESAWLKILPTPAGVSFGWIPVTPLAQNLNARINSLLFGEVQFTNMLLMPSSESIADGNLILTGVAK